MWWPLVRFLCGILRHSDCMMLLGWLAVQNPLLQWNVGIVPKQLYVCTHAFPHRGQSAPGKGQVAHNRTAHSHTTEHSLPQEQAKLLKTEQHIPTPQSTVCPRNRPSCSKQNSTFPHTLSTVCPRNRPSCSKQNSTFPHTLSTVCPRNRPICSQQRTAAHLSPPPPKQQ